jgi:hypothetical protein
MKKSEEFVWTDEADAALKDLKSVLSTTPVLAAPKDKEPMLLYMAATNRVVSIVVVVELWGPRLTTRDSRYAYNSRSQEDRREST